MTCASRQSQAPSRDISLLGGCSGLRLATVLAAMKVA
eukprot:CAMPEP_0204153586 /NCGR_PEP_ID=MMETSP0361-20130328/27978_1 /ASSEMBLY_ACC=CAM_ASM_000343 /TAXON_ID=268821 /ORGANISM="Scrippsiella Hangoei, Strain SHTV-5" /LENGTH=36 /DNA_ID= /DNA_START= /DNA_END= /DNA_ORIENTATION=